MGRGICRALTLTAALIAGAGCLLLRPCRAAGLGDGSPPTSLEGQAAAPANAGFFDSLGNMIKAGFSSIGDALTFKPKVTPPADPTKLQTPARVGPNLHVAMGRLYEDQGNLPEAAEQYQQALKLSENDVKAIIGLAHVKSRQGDLPGASKLYDQAAKLAPSEPSVFNDMALCFAQRWMHNEAIAAMGQAIRLQPNNLLYRNNMATILVDAGRYDDALQQLRVMRPEPVAHYNLGYLLNKKGQTDEALRHFVIAASQDPSLMPARQMVQRIQASRAMNVAAARNPAGVEDRGMGGGYGNPANGAGLIPVQPAYTRQAVEGNQPDGPPPNQGVWRLPPVESGTPSWAAGDRPSSRPTTEMYLAPAGGSYGPPPADVDNPPVSSGAMPPSPGSYNFLHTARVPSDSFNALQPPVTPLPPLER